MGKKGFQPGNHYARTRARKESTLAFARLTLARARASKIGEHEGTPTSSWWTETSRETFTARAWDEARRMSRSKFGRVQTPVTV